MVILRVDHQRKLKSALQFMIGNFQKDICLEDIANRVGITKFSLCRAFRRELHITPMHWLWRYRTYVSAEVITQYPHHQLNPIMQSCGFKHPAHFSRTFKMTLKVRPSAFKRSICKMRHVQARTHNMSSIIIGSDIMQKALHKTMETLD